MARRAVSPAARGREVARRLARAYGPGHPLRPQPAKRDPLDELILTVLSQHTSDLNRDKAWARLKQRYPAWEQVVRARTETLAKTIAIGGLANSKAPRIQAILREIREREGALSLDRLHTLPSEQAREYLTSLPGIGPKTAACVLAFALERPILPVDTHVHRIAQRLGFVGSTVTAEATEGALEAFFPPETRIGAHLDLIAHGRAVCKAQRPLCPGCPLLTVCPTGEAAVAGG